MAMQIQIQLKKFLAAMRTIDDGVDDGETERCLKEDIQNMGNTIKDVNSLDCESSFINSS